MELMATDELSGNVGDIILTCERLLPYYEKGDSFNNGIWHEPKHHSARTRLKAAGTAGDTTIQVSNRDVMKSTAEVAAGARVIPVDSHYGFRVGDIVTVANNIADQTTTLAASASASAYSLTLADSSNVAVQQEVKVALTDGSTHEATVVAKLAGDIVKLNKAIPSGASSGATFTMLGAIEAQITKLWGQGRAKGYPDDLAISIETPAHIVMPADTAIAQANISGEVPGNKLKTGDDILIQTNGDNLTQAPAYISARLTSDLTPAGSGLWSFTIASPGLTADIANDGLVIHDRSKFKTQSPAWAFAEILRGPGQPRPIADKYIDADSLKDWHDFTLDPAGDRTYNAVTEQWEQSQPAMHFNTVIDFRSTTMELLERVASSARASVHMRDGRIGVIWDRNRLSGAYAAAPTAMFTPRNILQGSYTNSFGFTDMPHAIRLRFTDTTGAAQEHIIYAAGYSEDGSDGTTKASRYDQITAWGITDPDEAYRYAVYSIKSMEMRNETVGVDVDLEGSVMVERGDLVLISHDVDFTGLTWGRIKSIAGTGDATSITIENEVTIEHGSDYVVRVREAGTNSFPFYDVTNSATAGSPITTTAIPLHPSASTSNASNPAQVADLTVGDLVAFGKSEKETRRMIVSGVNHKENLTASLNLVPEAPEIFTSELTGTIPTADNAQTFFPDRLMPKPPRINDCAVVRDEVEKARRRIRASISPPLADNVQVSHFEVQFKRFRYHASGVFPAIVVNHSNNWGGDITVPAAQTVMVHSDFLEAISHPEEVGQVAVRVRSVRTGAPHIKSEWVESQSVDRISAAMSEYLNVRVRHLQLTRGWWGGLRPGGTYDPSFNRFTEFFSASPSFRWSRHASFTEPPMEHMQGEGGELYPDPLTGDLYTQAEILQGLPDMTYMVEIKDTAGTLLRSEEVNGTQYTYDLEKNVIDGGPRRDFTIAVSPKFAIPKVGETVSLSVSNPAHPAPTFTAGGTDRTSHVRIVFDATTERRPDFAGYVLCGSTTTGFTPSASNVLSTGSSLDDLVIPGLEPTTWYFRAACYDKFHEASENPSVSSLTFSSEVSATLSPVISGTDILIGDPTNMVADPVWRYSGKYGKSVLDKVMTYDSYAQLSDNSRGWGVVTAENSVTPRTGNHMLRHETGDYSTTSSSDKIARVLFPAVEGYESVGTAVGLFEVGTPISINQQGWHIRPGDIFDYQFFFTRSSGMDTGVAVSDLLIYDENNTRVGTWDGLAVDSGYDYGNVSKIFIGLPQNPLPAVGTWSEITKSNLTIHALENTGSTISGSGYNGANAWYTWDSIRSAAGASNPALLVASTPVTMFFQLTIFDANTTSQAGYGTSACWYFDNFSIRRKDET